MDTLKKLMEKIKKYGELWSKMKDLIRLITKNSDDYDQKYTKIKFNSDDELPLNKTIEIPSMAIVVRTVLMKIKNVIHKFSWMNFCINFIYLIKYKAKQKLLLPFYVPNNKLKRFVLLIYYKNGK